MQRKRLRTVQPKNGLSLDSTFVDSADDAHVFLDGAIVLLCRCRVSGRRVSQSDRRRRTGDEISEALFQVPLTAVERNRREISREKQ